MTEWAGALVPVITGLGLWWLVGREPSVLRGRSSLRQTVTPSAGVSGKDGGCGDGWAVTSRLVTTAEQPGPTRPAPPPLPNPDLDNWMGK